MYDGSEDALETVGGHRWGSIACGFYYSAIQGETEKEPDNYSVILYQHTDNEWAILRRE